MSPATKLYVARDKALCRPRQSFMSPATKLYVARDKALCRPRQSFMLPATKLYVARGDILNKKTSFNSFPDNIVIERPSNFENL
jgi:hypothetical protein